MNNTTIEDNSNQNHESSDHIFALASIFIVSIIFSLMDIIPVVIILWSRRLRKPANFAIVSFLMGATIQAMVTCPLYMYKRLEDDKYYKPFWVCDAFRLPYFLASHTMKISLLIVSYDRLCAIRFPFRYDTLFTKRNMTYALLIVWIVILSIDIAPFFSGVKDKENCTYLPPQIWGVAVIILFNILPFVLMAANYFWLWRIASKINLKDRKVNARLLKNSNDLNSNNANLNCKSDQEIVNESLQNEKPKLLQQHSYMQAIRKGYPIRYQDLTHQSGSKQINRQDQSSFTASCFRMRKALRLVFELKATKTSFLLLAVYLFCWGPLGIFYMIDHFCTNCLSYVNHEKLSDARFAVKILCFLSSPIAPLVYCWRTKEFRLEALKFFCNKTYKKRRSEEFSKTSWNMSQYSLSASSKRKYASSSSLRSTIKL